MIDASSATEYLTSTLKGFRMEASEAMDAVSALVELDMLYASSAGETAEALARTATSAQLVGMTYNEVAAALTTIIDVSQRSASSVGEAWRTLTTRYSNVAAGNFEDLMDGEDTEGLNDVEKVFNTLGISIRDSKMEFRDFSDVLDDLAEKWISMSSVEQSAVATALAGTRQRETFLVLMENYDEYQEALEAAEDSSGTAEKKYEAYLDSIEAHINQLTTAWESLAQTFEASDFFKGLVDFATWLVEALPKIIKYVSTLFITLNSYKLPTWISSLGSALNPFASTASGRYQGAGKFWTKSGMQDRANIYKYERARARGEDTTELEAKLPQAYKDRFKAETDPAVSELQTANETLRQIAANTAKSDSGTAGTQTPSQPTTGQPAAGQPTAGQPTAGQPTAGQAVAGAVAGGVVSQTVTNTQEATAADNSAELLKLKKELGGPKSGDTKDLYHQWQRAIAAKGGAKAKGTYDAATDDKGVNKYDAAIETARKNYLNKEAELTKLMSQPPASVKATATATATAGEQAKQEAAEVAKAVEEAAEEATDTRFLMMPSEAAGIIRSKVESGKGTLYDKALLQRYKELYSKGDKKARKTASQNLEKAVKEEKDASAEVQRLRDEGYAFSEEDLADGETISEDVTKALERQAKAQQEVEQAKLKCDELDQKSLNVATDLNNAAQQRQADLGLIQHSEMSLVNTENQGVYLQQMKNDAEAQELLTDQSVLKAEEDITTQEQQQAGLAGTGASGAKTTGTSTKTSLLPNKTSAMSGVATGITSAITSFATTEGDTTDKLISAGMSGVLSGVGTAFLGPIGGMIGNVIGDVVSGWIIDAIHADEYAREERVEEAEELLEVLADLSSSVDDLSDSVASRDEWTADDYAELNDTIAEVKESLRADSDTMKSFLSIAASMDSSLQDKTVSQLLQLLVDGTDEQAETIVQALSLATTSASATATYASQEEERYEAQEAIDDATTSKTKIFGVSASESKALRTALSDVEGINYSWISDYQRSTVKITAQGETNEEQLDSLYEMRAQIEEKALTAAEENNTELQDQLETLIDTIDDQIAAYEDGISTIDSLNDEMNEAYVVEAFTASLAQWDSVKIANSTLEEAIYQMAQELSLMGTTVYDVTGQITEEARDYITNYLREQESFSSLFATDDTVLRQLLAQSSQLSALMEAAGVKEYEDLTKAFETNDEEAQKELLEKINSATDDEGNLLYNFSSTDDLIHTIYNLDPTSLESFAEALGMTTDELVVLQDKLGNVSLADLMGDTSDTLEELNEQMDYLNEIMEDGCLSAESYFDILTQYTELLYEYDENGNLVGMGTENIVSNLLANLYGGEGNLGTLMGYQNYEELKANTSIYDAFKEIVGNSSYADTYDLSWMETFDTFSDDFLIKLKATDEGLWQMYSEMMTNMMYSTSEYQELVESLMDYEITMIEQEVDSLESMKDALSDVNDERDKELELIKAKDALENAKEEKVMVYRAGEIYALDNYIG